MHESTQRLVCRVLFVLLAVVPAVGTALYVAYSLRPWAEEDWQQFLSQQLHLHVQVGKVETPRPGVQVLTDVQVADLRARKPLAEINEARLTWQSGKLSLSIDQLDLLQANFRSLASAVNTSLAASALPPARVESDRVLILGREQQQLELANMRMQVASDQRDRRLISLECELKASKNEGPFPLLHFDVARQTRTTSAKLDTGGTHLPTWVLAELWPSLADSAKSTFAGRIVLNGSSRELEGSLHGRIEGIDLASWLGEETPHTLEGIGQLVLDDFRWKNDRIEVAHGDFEAAQGQVSKSLLAEMKELLFCQLGPAANLADESDKADLIPFDDLSCGFHLTHSGLTLTGRCQSIRDGAPGCMLAWRGEAVLLEPSYADLPVGQLVRVLSHPAMSWLPATVEANEMAGSLPLPRVGPRPQPAKQEVAAQPKDSTSL